jgi:hypothetical protein
VRGKKHRFFALHAPFLPIHHFKFMRFRFYCQLLFILSLLIVNACSRREIQKEITLEDKNDPIVIKEGEVRFDDTEFTAIDAQKIDGQNSQKVSAPGADNTEIVVMKDNFGNVIETRNFRNHSRLFKLVIQTGADGKREIKVYGQNGEMKVLPSAMSEQVLTARGDEIANAAGIMSGRPIRIINNSASPPPVAVGNQTISNGEMQIRTLPPIRLPESQPVSTPVNNNESSDDKTKDTDEKSETSTPSAQF